MVRRVLLIRFVVFAIWRLMMLSGLVIGRIRRLIIILFLVLTLLSLTTRMSLYYWGWSC